MLGILNVKAWYVRYIHGTERAFNTDCMVHKGFTIPIRSHFESTRGTTLVLRVDL
jgi:hypothetical protein